jgi:hypothetical protein
MNKKHGAWLRAGMGVVFALSMAGVQMSGQTKLATSKTKVTEEAYKNIQTLKGIPADQLISAMPNTNRAGSR